MGQESIRKCHKIYKYCVFSSCSKWLVADSHFTCIIFPSELPFCHSYALAITHTNKLHVLLSLGFYFVILCHWLQLNISILFCFFLQCSASSQKKAIKGGTLNRVIFSVDSATKYTRTNHKSHARRNGKHEANEFSSPRTNNGRPIWLYVLISIA